MKQSTIIVLLAVLVVVGGGVYWYSSMQGGSVQPAEQSTNTATTTTENPTGQASTTVGVGVTVGSSAVPMSATVTYSADGFSPQAVTIKKGGTVTWVNEGDGNMWVGAASHPSHTSYSGTTLAEHCGGTAPESFDQCENGDQYSFTFDKVGKWNYHNHSRASHFGSVTVVE